MNNRGLLAFNLLFSLSKIANPENTTQFNLVKDSSSNKVNDLLIHNTITVTLKNNLLTFRDTDQKFELKGGLFTRITNKNYNVHLASLSDKKLMFDYAKDMYFNVRKSGIKNTRDKPLIKLLNSPAIMAPGISKISLPGNLNELCDRSKLLLQEKQAGNTSDIINGVIVAIVDKQIEHKCISTKQHKILQVKGLN